MPFVTVVSAGLLAATMLLASPSGEPPQEKNTPQKKESQQERNAADGAAVSKLTADQIILPGERIAPDIAPAVRIEGLRPGSRLRLGARRAFPSWPARLAESSAVFEADEAGTIDTSRDAPVSGDWSEADPFALLASMKLSERASASEDPAKVTLLIDQDREGQDGHGQWDAAPRPSFRVEVDRRGLLERDLSEQLPGAFLLAPESPGPHPAVILLGGSEGDDGFARRLAPLLAVRGYAVMGLPYYSPGYWSGEPKFPELPRAFADLPLEYLDQACNVLIDLKSGERGLVDRQRIGLIGSSKGAEFALSAAARIDRFAAVAAIVPSDVIWEGWGAGRPAGETSGFSWQGEPLPFVPYVKMRETLEARSNGERVRLRDPHDDGRAAAGAETIAAARIPVEQIDAPVFLLAGGADATWDSGGMAQNIAAARQRAGLPTVLKLYPEAGHSLSGPPSLPGSREEARARQDAWPAMLAFLQQHLQSEKRCRTPFSIRGGRVWTEEGFQRRDLFVRGGRFVESLDRPAECVIDASGKVILPPLAEGHCHTFFGGPASLQTSRRYLQNGIFYAASMNNPTRVAREYREAMRQSTGPLVDALFANGGITTRGGHPVPLYRKIWTTYQQRDPETFRENLADNAFYETKNVADVRAKLELLLQGEPDLVKLYLLHSEYRTDRDPTNESGGLDADRLAEAVELAHQQGKRVAVHVESRADVRLAAEAGVDALAHLPYNYNPGAGLQSYALTDEDVAALRRAEVSVIATHFLVTQRIARRQQIADDAERTEKQRREAAQYVQDVRRISGENLQKLKAAGVPILIGSDANTPVAEVTALETTGLFSTDELIAMWAVQTPQWLFPDRQLGRLAPGYEASFLVLEREPQSPSEIPDLIVAGYKQGERIEYAEP